MKALKFSILTLPILLSACGGGSNGGPVSIVPSTTLSSGFSHVVWEDNFATDAPGAPVSTTWAMLTGNGAEYNNAGWGNNEAEYYLPSDVTISNGLMKIHGHANSAVSGNQCAGAACQFSSGKVTSVQPVDLSKPGLLEIQATLPTSTGSWPAIWLLPGTSPGQAFPPTASQLASQPTWPAGGEIDMAEYLSRYFTNNNLIQSTLHFPQGAAPYTDGYFYEQATFTGSISQNYHIYQLVWDLATIKFYTDNNLVMTCYKTSLTCTPTTGSANTTSISWPYGTTFGNYYLILNLAIGGNLGASSNAAVPANYDETMQIAYVRYMTTQ